MPLVLVGNVVEMLPKLVPVLEPSFQNKTVTWKQTQRGVDDMAQNI